MNNVTLETTATDSIEISQSSKNMFFMFSFQYALIGRRKQRP